MSNSWPAPNPAPDIPQAVKPEPPRWSRLQLRAYQEAALEAVHDAEARGVRRQMIVAATGLGKTVIFTALAQQRADRGRTLILAHRDELVTQAVAKVREVWPDVHAGIVKADQDAVDAQVVVASVQTLARGTRLRRLLQSTRGTDTLHGAAGGPFGLVVVDEAHHTAADTYQRILKALRAGESAGPCGCGGELVPESDGDEGGGCHLVECPVCDGSGQLPDGPLLVGVTATPQRGDGQALDGTFTEVVFTRTMQWGIQQGYLSDLRGIRLRVDMNMAGLKISRGDYDQGQAGALLEQAGAPALIAEQWKIHAPDRRTLVFTPTVAVAQQVADEFQARGVRAGWVSGETDQDERRRILRAYSTGELQVLANCAVLTEGYDEPRTDCVVVARPTRSQALYVQMVGRGTRRHPEKADCLVLDVVGATAEHSLVTIPSLFGLDDAARKRMERDGIGAGQAKSDMMEAAARSGRIRAEEANLWRMARRDGLAWVQVHRDGDVVKRFLLALSRELELVMYAAPNGDWLVEQRQLGEAPRLLIQGVSMELAQGVAEDYVRTHATDALRLVDTNAAWRQRRPTSGQLAAAGKWHLAVDPKWNSGQLSDALTAHIARRKARATR